MTTFIEDGIESKTAILNVELNAKETLLYAFLTWYSDRYDLHRDVSEHTREKYARNDIIEFLTNEPTGGKADE
jgi:hypothetical protein